MGNKLCKKKVENVDSQKEPSPFDRIIKRLHLKPNSWKSDSHLDEKQVNRYEVNAKNVKNGSVPQKRPLSNAKSSDWVDAGLEVPEKDEAIHLKNPQLALIFNDDSTPTPPPRKYKRSIREKIQSAARNSLQAFQPKKTYDEVKKDDDEPRIPVEEVLCVKKIISYRCPCHNQENCTIYKGQKHHSPQNHRKPDKEAKRKKNLSVVSLPNYNELKLSIAAEEKLKHIDSSLSNSATSLPGENKKLTVASTGKLETYMIRCRSFGSLIPQLKDKLKVAKIPADVESDDSFGGLEDWDLRILEHYNPKDASLPRPRKPIKTDKEILSDIENLVIQDDIDTETPERPLRRSESLLKKLNREASETAHKRRSTEMLDHLVPDTNTDIARVSPLSITPPPSPEPALAAIKVAPVIPAASLPTEDAEGNVEHSTLMKILEEFSIKDAKKRETHKPTQKAPATQVQQTVQGNIAQRQQSSMVTKPPVTEFKKSTTGNKHITHSIQDFINAEKGNIEVTSSFTKIRNEGLPQNNDPARIHGHILLNPVVKS